MEIKKKIGAVLATALSVVIFAQGFYYAMRSIKDNAMTAEVVPMQTAVVTVTYETAECEPTPIAATPYSEPVVRKDVGCVPDFWSTLYTDSRGATAYGWEIEECIRELMLEAGGESDEDIREHAAVYCKQLLYAQTVGGYDDWGTTLHGVVYSHGYEETYPNIWTPAADPTQKVTEIFWDVWQNGYTSDFRVQVFRKDWYHSTTWSIPAYQIGRTCYSINIWQDFSMFE